MSRQLAIYVDAVEGLASQHSPTIVRLTDKEVAMAKAYFAACRGTTQAAENIIAVRKGEL